MVLTQFLPLFLLLAIFAFRSPRHWVIAMGIGCFFQGATPFLIGGGGRMVALAPAYLLLVIGLYHEFGTTFRGQRRSSHVLAHRYSPAQLWLWSFTAVGVIGAYVLPRLFSGMAHAMPVRGSLDSGLFLLVYPTSSNLFQAIYLLLNAMLVWLVSRMMAREEITPADLIRGISIGALCSAGFGIYQVVAHYTGLPWPRNFVNSNIGVGQFPEQVVGNIKRITATFWEPSLLSYNFVGTIGLLLLGGTHRRIGFLVLAVQLMSTSSVGYVALTMLTCLWLLFARAPSEHKLGAVAIGTLLAAAALVLDFAFADGTITREMLLEKSSSSSAVNRNYANYLAFMSFIETWGLGVGFGGARASSLFATLLATTGALGVLTFLMFLLCLLRNAVSSPEVWARAFGLGMLGFTLVWIISIPDIGQPLFWLVAGGAIGHQMVMRQKQARPTPPTTQEFHHDAHSTVRPAF